MADQRIAIENMPDSGSAARVAYQLMLHMKDHLPKAGSGEERIKMLLDLYADCYHATSGARSPSR